MQISQLVLPCMICQPQPPSAALHYGANFPWNHLLIQSTNIYWTPCVYKALLPASTSPYFLRSCFLSISLKRMVKRYEQKGTTFALPQNSIRSEEECWLIRAAITNIPWLGGLNNRHLSLTVLGYQVQDQGANKSSAISLQMAVFSLYLYTGEREGVGRENKLLGLKCCPYKGTLIHSKGLHSRDLITTQRPPFLKSSHEGLGFQHVHLGGWGKGTQKCSP